MEGDKSQGTLYCLICKEFVDAALVGGAIGISNGDRGTGGWFCGGHPSQEVNRVLAFLPVGVYYDRFGVMYHQRGSERG